ncbi:hypothetical protein ACT8ZV_22505 [Nocardioides sp. MAHUQ-72]|uniref:hypothetical protein n=1 Tax=unclassified Nocardioides TaxID=2615069 RepID=UPI003618A72C
MLDAVALIVAAGGLLVFFVSLSALAARRREAGPSDWMVLGILMLGVFQEAGILGSETILQLTIVGFTAACALFAILLGRGSAPKPTRATVQGVALVWSAWLVMFLSDFYNNYSAGNVLLLRLAPGVMWLCVLMAWSVRQPRRDIAALGVAATLGLASALVLASPEPFRACDQFKCGALGALLEGPFASENYYALLAAATIALALGTGLGRRVTLPLYATAGLVLVAAGSRSAQIALAVALLVHLFYGDGRPRTPPRWAGWMAMPAAAGVGLWLVYNAKWDSFSNRGGVWIQGRETLAGHELIGLGITRWSGYGSLPAVSHHYPHSFYLLAIFSGGMLALVLLLAGLAKGVTASDQGRGARLVYASAFVVLGFTEADANLMSIDGLSWTLLPFFLLGAPALIRQRREAERAGSQLSSDEFHKALTRGRTK